MFERFEQPQTSLYRSRRTIDQITVFASDGGVELLTAKNRIFDFSLGAILSLPAQIAGNLFERYGRCWNPCGRTRFSVLKLIRSPGELKQQVGALFGGCRFPRINWNFFRLKATFEELTTSSIALRNPSVVSSWGKMLMPSPFATRHARSARGQKCAGMATIGTPCLIAWYVVALPPW